MNKAEQLKIKKIVSMLKYILTVDDKDIVQTSLEQIIEMLEEDIK